MAKQLPKRQELPASETWDLTPLYTDNEAWEKDFASARALIASFPSLQGTLHQSEEALLHALEQESEISLLLERLYVYAHMRRDEDNAVALYQGMTDRAMQLGVQFGAGSAFFSPEILSIDKKTLDTWIQGKTLFPYRRVLKNLVRSREHTLNAGEEQLLALASEPLGAADQVFTMLNNADLRFSEITDEEGEQVELSHGNYRHFIESTRRDIREKAYRTLYRSYISLQNTLAATYTASVKGDVFHTRARKYKSAIEAGLFAGNVPLSVYNSLIEAVESRLGDLKKYLELRKNALKLQKLHMYDLYVPIVENPKWPMKYSEAKVLVLDALKPLGEEYCAIVQKAYDERWIDVQENRGKTTGAYSWGAYGVHPYVLLNYQPEASYAFTVAHELGHAMHTYFSDTSLPYQDAQYRIMAAEVASTVNEVLLLKHMLATETDKARRSYLINYYLEQFRTTVFRQTMFAAFEQKTHAMCEAGEPLTVESLCEVYGRLNEKYYPDVVVDEEIRMEWARIPHFYNAFYVYQYATGFCAAVKLAKGILAGGEAKDRYLAFLKSGGSDFPIALLQKAGADLTDPAGIQNALDEFQEGIKELAGE